MKLNLNRGKHQFDVYAIVQALIVNRLENPLSKNKAFDYIQKDYLEDLLNVLKNLDGLPDRYSKLIRAFDEKTLAEDLRKFKIEVPHSYLMKIIKKSNVINEGKEQLILSEEF